MRSLIKLQCLAFFLMLISFSYSLSANDRVVTIKNNCSFDVLWSMSNRPITDKNGAVSCNTPLESCFNGNGICGENKQCYFKYPAILAGSDKNPSYYLSAGTNKAYKISSINIDTANNTTKSQYVLNIAAQYGCTKSANGTYSCLSANCERITSPNSPMFGFCKPDKKLQAPLTKAKIIFNEKENDIYSLNISNGPNLPMSITPNGNFEEQSDISPNFFCNTTGGTPNNSDNMMNGCSWKFTPPFKPYIFTSISRDLSNNTTCNTNEDCKDPDNPVCGLKYPEDLKGYDNTGYCGAPVGYYTAATICSLEDASDNLTKLFNCTRSKSPDSNGQKITADSPIFMRCPDDYFELSLHGITDSKKQFCNYELYQCATQSTQYDATEYKYLDSCYKYSDDNPSDAASLKACCGCADWDGLPSESSTPCVQPLKKWVDLVKPKLQWLVDGCPDALEYKFANAHSTLECKSKILPNTTANNTNNNINYTITFCPGGEGLFKNQVTVNNDPQFQNVNTSDSNLTELDDFIDDLSKYIYLILIALTATVVFLIYHFKMRK